MLLENLWQMCHGVLIVFGGTSKQALLFVVCYIYYCLCGLLFRSGNLDSKTTQDKNKIAKNT